MSRMIYYNSASHRFITPVRGKVRQEEGLTWGEQRQAAKDNMSALIREEKDALKKQVESFIALMCVSVSIDTPRNFDKIVEYICDDVKDSTSMSEWNDGDIAIAFRRYLEKDET